ncbi:MAG: MAF protein [Motiliproteus sp.]|jgi:MAF protein
MLQLILASTSVYRKSLLEKLQLNFSCQAPDMDETPVPGESARELVIRLARAKAEAVGRNHPGALIIGSDQVALLNDTLIGKPHDHQRATAQLRASSGQTLSFYTGLCLHNSATGSSEVICEPFSVHFRTLSDAQIERYLIREQPYQCAGSFKAEGLGISLFEKLEGDDPNTLVGLPLIRLIALLQRQGVEVP